MVLLLTPRSFEQLHSQLLLLDEATVSVLAKEEGSCSWRWIKWRAFVVENQNQMSFYPFVLHEISVLVELILGHLRYSLTDVPPQPNSPPDNVFHLDQRRTALELEAGTESRLQLME